MKRSRVVFLGIGSALLVTLLGIPQTTQAGPPLICHPLDIGGAKSLPWIGGDRPSGADWRGVDPNYNLGQLVVDTLALLTPDTPVLVRMETMRRATVYAVWAMRDRKVGYSVKDDVVARRLLSELTAFLLFSRCGDAERGHRCAASAPAGGPYDRRDFARGRPRGTPSQPDSGGEERFGQHHCHRAAKLKNLTRNPPFFETSPPPR